jgi:hypothetical protein
MGISEDRSFEELLKNITFAIINKEGKVFQTGFFISSDGWALTAHPKLLQKGMEVEIKYGEETLMAKVKRVSPEHDDVVVLYVPEAQVSAPVPLSTWWKKGDLLFAVGYQLQGYMGGLFSLNLRVVGDRHPGGSLCMVVQPTELYTSIQGGSSGGPVLNKRSGHIVGVITKGSGTIKGYTEGGRIIIRGNNQRPGIMEGYTEVQPITIVNDSPNFGVVTPFNELFPDWPLFLSLLVHSGPPEIEQWFDALGRLRAENQITEDKYWEVLEHVCVSPTRRAS